MPRMVNILKQIINHSNHPWEVCTGIAVGPESVLIGSAEASSSNALFPMCLGSSRGTALTIECNYQGKFWGQVLMLWMEHFTADRSILHVVGGAGKISYTSFPLRKFYAYLQIEIHPRNIEVWVDEGFRRLHKVAEIHDWHGILLNNDLDVSNVTMYDDPSSGPFKLHAPFFGQAAPAA